METEGRCRTCFGEFHKGRCDRCIHRSVVIRRQLAACEGMGPALAMLNGMSRGWKECIPAAASLMAYQWLQQKLLMPEYLIPMPVSFWQKQKMGYDPILLLAEEVGKIFSIPVISALKTRFDRAHFFAEGEFRYGVDVCAKYGKTLCDKRVLLIGPKLDDDAFRRAGLALRDFFPAQVEALAFVQNM